MIKIGRMFLIGFSIILIIIAGTIAVISPLYWTVEPPKPVLKYSQYSYGPTGYIAVRNGSSIIRIYDPAYFLNFTFLENGSIYAPEKIPFFNFTFTALNMITSLETVSYLSLYQNLIGYDMNLYFYLFKPINSTYDELVKTQNKSYSFNIDNTTYKDKFYWNSFTANNYLSSNVKKQFLFYEFIIQIVGRYHNGITEYKKSEGVFPWSVHVQYHVDKQNNLIFDKYKENSLPPFAGFSYIKWGILNFSILTGGIIFIAFSIIVLLFKNRRDFS